MPIMPNPHCYRNGTEYIGKQQVIILQSPPMNLGGGLHYRPPQRGGERESEPRVYHLMYDLSPHYTSTSFKSAGSGVSPDPGPPQHVRGTRVGG